MKRVVAVFTLVALLSLGAALPALAQGNGPAPGADCGAFFGAHVAYHAQAGHLGQHHNPGMHEGLANFLDHHVGHEHTCP